MFFISFIFCFSDISDIYLFKGLIGKNRVINSIKKKELLFTYSLSNVKRVNQFFIFYFSVYWRQRRHLRVSSFKVPAIFIYVRGEDDSKECR